ncbi:TRAP transporter small permease [Paludibacterium paludis]|uniref:TRAP transporter small permease protein n=1 Tax=Paludibacterium paludis TaxID=1225769 RepID=A0A918P177_9NEIS|nr:TRAP transporter small permease [Paludibacterium paludis]GGY12746.1 C4-dicarboxylate ABC transporter substrate-binding protein [Paludibacterium paludis]
MKYFNRLEEYFIAVLMAAATLVIFASVVHRYLSGLAIPGLQDWLVSINMSWAQEACIYLFVWMAKFGAAYGVRTGIHVGVDVMVNRLDVRLQRGFVIFGLLAGALFTGVIAYFGGRFVWELAFTDQTSPDLELPMWLVYLAVPCGSSLMCLRFLEVLFGFLKTGSVPHHDAAHVAGTADDPMEGGVV